jgi:hypothetical protein
MIVFSPNQNIPMQLRQNSFKKALARRSRQIGMWCNLTSLHHRDCRFDLALPAMLETLTSCDAGSETRLASIDMARNLLRFIRIRVVILIMLGIAGLIAAIVSIALPFPPMPPETDVFGFSGEREKSATELPPLQQFRARDGAAPT